MKRVICVLLTVIFALSLASCGTVEECTYDFLPSDYPLFVRISVKGLPIKGIKPTSPALQADSLPLSHQGSQIHKANTDRPKKGKQQ